MKWFSFLFLMALFFSASGQEKGIYWVAFSDKSNNPFSLETPEKYLSPRAIERRNKQGLHIYESDLPVNPWYLDSIKQKGVLIHNTSKWLNGASVICNDSAIWEINGYDFVDSVVYVGKPFDQMVFLDQTGKKRDSIPATFTLDNYYGYARDQIEMLAGKYLHIKGFKGEGIMIAVLDGGFTNVEFMPFFDSLISRNKLLFSKDFVDSDDYVYESSVHGTQVLSVMAANFPGLMIGSAPEATYVCLKTEDTRGEYLIEECNWVAALEYADSLGVDVVNSSVGYTVFNDSTMNYKYENLDGRTAMSTRAADIAFSKGMIIVSSAGNDGHTQWQYIDVPSDGFHVLSVGSVDLDGKRSTFSSKGPTPDGRIKPDVVAPGKGISVAPVYGNKVIRSHGTSFSAPLVTGLVAALWQAFPEKSNREILDALIQSSSQASTPNNEMGYGIPNFKKAFQILSNKE